MKPVILQAGINVPKEHAAFASKITGFPMLLRKAGTDVSAYTLP
jgi:hypothetical protein